jgi:gamma-glutamyltranspeptidase/glutathione hydrolase
MLQTLNLLEGFDLAGMGHNSADYIHTVAECMKLAYADREYYYGDPDFAKVPLRRLLSKAYARRRRELVDPSSASLELRPGDSPPIRATSVLDVWRRSTNDPGGHGGDTTSLQAIDRAGNCVSAVSSGGWLMSSPVIPGLGFPLGTRGQMFGLAAGHPNSLTGGKRPRTTLTPTLACRLRRPPHLAFASPGGDCQDQWALQFFLNVVEFGMSLQQAVEAATFWTAHFPGSFYPRTAEPGSLYVESRVPTRCLDDLASRGHRVSVQPAFSGGNTMAAGINRRTGVLYAAASPRYDPAYAMGW